MSPPTVAGPSSRPSTAVSDSLSLSSAWNSAVRSNSSATSATRAGYPKSRASKPASGFMEEPSFEVVHPFLKVATILMFDQHMNAKPTKFRYNDLPPAVSYIVNARCIDELQRHYRRAFCDKIQRIEKTFGPSVMAYSNPTEAISKLKYDCKNVELACAAICPGIPYNVDDSARDQVPTEPLVLYALSTLTNHYENFDRYLQVFYDEHLTAEWRLRCNLLVKGTGLQGHYHQYKNSFCFKDGQFQAIMIADTAEPSDKGKGKRKEKEKEVRQSFVALPLLHIPEKFLRERCLEQVLRLRSQSSFQVTFDSLLSKMERQEFPASYVPGDTPVAADRFVRALRRHCDYSASLCRVSTAIEECINTIARSSGTPYFFDETTVFWKFLKLWMGRFNIPNFLATSEQCQHARDGPHQAAMRDLHLSLRTGLSELRKFVQILQSDFLEKALAASYGSEVERLSKSTNLQLQEDSGRFLVVNGSLVPAREHPSSSSMLEAMFPEDQAAARWSMDRSNLDRPSPQTWRPVSPEDSDSSSSDMLASDLESAESGDACSDDSDSGDSDLIHSEVRSWLRLYRSLDDTGDFPQGPGWTNPGR